MDKKLVFSEHMIRLLTGLKRRAAKKRLPAKKAPILPLDTLKFLVKEEIIPFRNNPHLINKVVFRTIFRTMIEYFYIADLIVFPSWKRNISYVMMKKSQ